MALVTMKRLFDHAMKEKYTVGAYNVFNLDTLVAVLQAAEKEDSPVIVQLSMGSREYQPYFETFVRCVKLYAEAVHVPVGLNHDHCKTVEIAKEAIDYGIPSVMFDGSHLPFEENVASTREIVRYAHECGAWVEAELGKMAGFEDEVFAESTQFTDPHQAAEFIRLTGCDSLAVSVGTSHGGVAGDSSLKLHFDVLEAIRSAIPESYPLVLHGAASVPEELVRAINAQGAHVPQMRNCTEADISASAAYGVVKTNMDVDNHLCYSAAIRQKLGEITEKYDPRMYLKPAREAFETEVRHKMKNVSQSSGKNWLKENAE